MARPRKLRKLMACAGHFCEGELRGLLILHGDSGIGVIAKSWLRYRMEIIMTHEITHDVMK